MKLVCVTRRRKLKKSYEYEVRWAGAFAHPENDTWLQRDQCASACAPHLDGACAGCLRGCT